MSILNTDEKVKFEELPGGLGEVAHNLGGASELKVIRNPEEIIAETTRTADAIKFTDVAEKGFDFGMDEIKTIYTFADSLTTDITNRTHTRTNAPYQLDFPSDPEIQRYLHEQLAQPDTEPQQISQEAQTKDTIVTLQPTKISGYTIRVSRSIDAKEPPVYRLINSPAQSTTTNR